MAAAGEARAAYRALARAILRHVSGDRGSQILRHARAEFRRAGVAPEAAAEGVQLARDYALLVASVREHKELLLSYNIGVDRDARQRQTIQRSAASVGLQLPDNAWQDKAG